MRKKVLITGAAKGLGKEIALAFAKDGYDIVFTYFQSENEATTLKDEIENIGVEVEAINVNLLIDDDIDRLVNRIDRLDVLINNAAYNCDCSIFEKSSSTFLDILKVNLVAPFMLAQKLFPLLKDSHGVVLNVASTNGIDTLYPESLDYDASKAGLLNLTKNLSKAFLPDVKVYAVAPDWIETEAVLDMDPEFRAQEEDRMGGPFLKPSYVAERIKAIAEGDEKAEIITRIDGGSDNENDRID